MRRTTMIAAGMAMLGAAGMARADNAMKVCGAKYQAAKTAKTLPAGQTWNQFLAQCRGTAAAAAPTPAAKTAAPAKTTAAPGASKAAAPSAAMAAAHDRQRKCGQMWSAEKAAGKIPAGQTWPKYWSACNTRLKS